LKILKKRLQSDYTIYEYFKHKFNNIVKAFGEDRMAREILKLRETNYRMLSKCNITKSLPKGAKNCPDPGLSKVSIAEDTQVMCGRF